MEARAGVFLGLGSNVGDREASLEQALRRLEARGFRSAARSSLCGDEVLRRPRLVLGPLAEPDAVARHPLLGLTAQMLARCDDASRVVLRSPAPSRRP